jgi:hypothetical protein
MDEGSVEMVGRTEVKLPASEVVWFEAPESAAQSVTVGGVKAMALKELAATQSVTAGSPVVHRCSK